jgi:hypothetical protein
MNDVSGRDLKVCVSGIIYISCFNISYDWYLRIITVNVTCPFKCLKVSNILLIVYHILGIQLLTPYVFWYVSPVTLSRCSFVDGQQAAGDANTRNYENAGVKFTGSTGQKTQIHELIRTFEFNYKIWMWKYCAPMLLRYLIWRWNQVWTKVINTIAQYFNVKILKVSMFATAS